MRMRIGRILKIYRALEGLEQREVADQIGIGYSTLCRIEKGKSPDAKGMIKIIAWLFD